MGEQSTQGGTVDSSAVITNISDNLTNVVVIIGAISAAYYGVRKWVRKQVTSTENIEKQIKTRNGHTIGEQMDTLTEEFAAIKSLAEINSALIKEIMRWRDEHVRNHPD